MMSFYERISTFFYNNAAILAIVTLAVIGITIITPIVKSAREHARVRETGCDMRKMHTELADALGRQRDIERICALLEDPTARDAMSSYACNTLPRNSMMGAGNCVEIGYVTDRINEWVDEGLIGLHMACREENKCYSEARSSLAYNGAPLLEW